MRIALLAAALLAFVAADAGAQPAAAAPEAEETPITCAEVLNMIALGVPDSIVADSVQAREVAFTPKDVECLRAGGASADVLAAAGVEAADDAPAEAPIDAKAESPAPKPAAEPSPTPGLSVTDEQLRAEMEAFLLFEQLQEETEANEAAKAAEAAKPARADETQTEDDED